MDDWTPLGRTEDYPANPQGLAALLASIRRLETQLNDQRHAILRQSGISVEPGGIRFAGDVAITGALTLNPGVIGNEYLTSPL
ncbi:hypothetical protein, partial [Motilibacter aurantiacus]